MQHNKLFLSITLLLASTFMHSMPNNAVQLTLAALKTVKTANTSALVDLTAKVAMGNVDPTHLATIRDIVKNGQPVNFTQGACLPEDLNLLICQIGVCEIQPRQTQRPPTPDYMKDGYYRGRMVDTQDGSQRYEPSDAEMAERRNNW